MKTTKKDKKIIEELNRYLRYHLAVITAENNCKIVSILCSRETNFSQKIKEIIND